MIGLLVYRAINAIAAELAKAGIPKTNRHKTEDYEYRSIDDVLNRRAPLLAKHRLCDLPQVLRRSAMERRGDQGATLIAVELKVAFDFISADDGSRHSAKVFGEALDIGDKAPAKAMAAAFKTAMIQSLCVPVPGNDDADRLTPKLAKLHDPEPVQRWPQWAADIIDMIGICKTEEALVRVQDGKRAELKAISRERNQLYVAIGEAFASRRAALAERGNGVASAGGCAPAAKRTALAKAKVAELARCLARFCRSGSTAPARRPNGSRSLSGLRSTSPHSTQRPKCSLLSPSPGPPKTMSGCLRSPRSRMTYNTANFAGQPRTAGNR